jgi:hypothetical protein
VDEGGGFDHVGVDAPEALGFSASLLVSGESLGYPAPYLGDLQGVSKAIVEHDAFGRRDDLSHVPQAPQGRGVQHAIPVPLSPATVIFGFVLRV